MKSMYGFTSKTLTITGILIAFVALISFAAGIRYSSYKSGLASQATQKNNLETTSGSQIKIKTSPLFRSQTANVQATLVNFTNNKLTLKNDKGQQDSFAVASNVQVFEFTNTTTPPKPTDLKSIIKDRDALVVLQFTNGEYQVATVSYLPKTNTPPPPPKP